VNEEDREILDNADSEAVKQAIIDVLREGDGGNLRALLKVLRNHEDTGVRALYEKFIRHPDLHDLVPH
jgi:hypothetical protein